MWVLYHYRGYWLLVGGKGTLKTKDKNIMAEGLHNPTVSHLHFNILIAANSAQSHSRVPRNQADSLGNYKTVAVVFSKYLHSCPLNLVGKYSDFKRFQNMPNNQYTLHSQKAFLQIHFNQNDIIRLLHLHCLGYT